MSDKIWAVVTECKCDGDDEFGSWFSLFKNYDDACQKPLFFSIFPPFSSLFVKKNPCQSL